MQDNENTGREEGIILGLNNITQMTCKGSIFYRQYMLQSKPLDKVCILLKTSEDCNPVLQGDCLGVGLFQGVEVVVEPALFHKGGVRSRFDETAFV